MSVTGIDGYRSGWIAAHVSSGQVSWSAVPVPDVAELLDGADVVGIDMPIGLADSGWRECDTLAKRELGSAASRVFMTPPRRVLELGMRAPNAIVQELSRELTGQGTSRQAMALAERILTLDSALADHPEAAVVEVHPEVSFKELVGRPLSSKKSARGVGERLAALRTWFPQVDSALSDVPVDVPVDDALDALVCAWSADRWRSGRARTLPTRPDGSPCIVI
jgi:predicted RNase H-like nuclease